MSSWRIAQLAQQMLSPPASSSAAAEQPLRGYPYMLAQQQKRTSSALKLGASSELEWFVLNDVVMGGESESACEPDAAGGLTFRGVISTVGGGFCSCRTHESSIAPPAGKAAAVKMRYTCDDALYKVTLSTGSMSSRALSWQFQLLEQGPGTYTATVPLSSFTASMHGQDMSGHILNAADLTSVGLNCSIFDMHGQAIAGKVGGAFEITLHSLEWVQAIDEHDEP